MTKLRTPTKSRPAPSDFRHKKSPNHSNGSSKFNRVKKDNNGSPSPFKSKFNKSNKSSDGQFKKSSFRKNPKELKKDFESEYGAVGEKTKVVNFGNANSTGLLKGTIDFEGPEEEEKKSKGKKSKKLAGGGFQAMGLSFPVLKGILKRGYKIPTPIQRKTIPLLLNGKDVVAMARTGSGKTAAFLIPLLEKLAQTPSVSIGTSSTTSFPKALILSPTRELAVQTLTFIRELSRYMSPPIRVVSVVGGESMDSQFECMHSKPHVLIGTPGRFMHLCVEMELKLGGVQTVVFDEADRLFEMGFGVQITEIIQRLPINRQTVLFSATLPKLLVEFTKAGLTDPTLIRLDTESKLSENLKLVYLASRSDDKNYHLLYLLKNIINYEREQSIIFVATKYHVDYLHAILNSYDIPNTYIYSSLDGSARKISLDKFRMKKVNILIVTDIAARGIDIPLLDNVINYHFPSKPKLFMHRVGRVARAGCSGTSYSIVSPDEIAYLLDLHLFLSKPLSFSPEAKEGEILVGVLPQEAIDNEVNSFTNLVQSRTNEDFSSLTKVCKNGYKQYLKSRPPASAESNRRAKGIRVGELPIHPSIFPNYEPDAMNVLIKQIQTFRPRTTIFEIGPAKKSSSSTILESSEVMKVKRTKDQEKILKFRNQKKMDNNVDNENDKGSKIVSKKDSENFINYLPSDFHTETGLSVGTTAAFHQEIQNSCLDLTGDDANVLKSQRSVMRWDEKKKKFVGSNSEKGKGTNNGVAAKKIRTESGAWISSSYKSNRYEQWKSRSKITNQSDGSNSDSDGDEKNTINNRSFKPTTQNKSANGRRERKKPFRTEIKKPEVILKNRKMKEKNMKKNSHKGKKGKKSRHGGGGGGSRSKGKK